MSSKRSSSHRGLINTASGRETETCLPADLSSADSLVPRTNPAVKSGTTTDCADGIYVSVHVQGMP